MDIAIADYLPILIFMFVALAISCLFVLANFLVAVNNPDPEKNSAYECGFEQFGDSRMKFDVRFYLVTLLFIIFLIPNSQGLISDLLSFEIKT